MVILAGAGDQTCCNIQYSLQLISDRLWRRGQDWVTVTVVHARCDKALNKCLQWLSVQQMTDSSQLAKPEKACLANTRDMPIKAKVCCNYDTEQSNMVTRPYDIGAKLEWWSAGSKCGQLVSWANPEKLGLVGVQLQAIGWHPVPDFRDTVFEFADGTLDGTLLSGQCK